VAPEPALFGLVLAGGRSTRMGRDKGQIAYHGVPQREWLQVLLGAVCAHAFISINADQRAGLPAHLPVVIDDPRYETSPLGALLSAVAAHPGAAWLLVSCDLAYFDANCLNILLRAREHTAAGTAFRIAELGQPEPLATLYEASFVATLPAAYAAGERSLRRALHRAGALLIAAEGRCCASVDTPEAADDALSYWANGSL
jgi:molybdenum cofactor guanylyltransferase